jgi:hypothetical protein
LKIWLLTCAAPHAVLSLIYLQLAGLFLSPCCEISVSGKVAPALLRLLVFVSGPAVFIGQSGLLYFAITAIVLAGSLGVWYLARHSLIAAAAIAGVTVFDWLLCPFVVFVVHAA